MNTKISAYLDFRLGFFNFGSLLYDKKENVE